MTGELFITSDYHNYHKLVAQLRGFSTPIEMSETLFDNTNKIVKDRDKLIELGDFCFQNGSPFPSYEDTARECRARLNVREIIHLRGNHDRLSIDKFFSQAHDIFQFSHNKQSIFCCHYPVVSFNGMRRGGWHFHGHCHDSLFQWKEQNIPNAKIIDVGLDSAKRILGEYRPFHIDELKEIMDKLPGMSVDHHK